MPSHDPFETIFRAHFGDSSADTHDGDPFRAVFEAALEPRAVPAPDVLSTSEHWIPPRRAHAAARSRYPTRQGMMKWRRDWETSSWAKDFRGAEVRRNVGSILHDDFRDRFRVSFSIFDEIVKAFRASVRVADDTNPKQGPPPIPVDLKVMHCLRRMSKGTSADPFEEGSGCSARTMQRTFLEWAHFMVDHFYDDWVRPPRTREDIARHVRVFQELGMPGTFHRFLPLRVAHGFFLRRGFE